jgi:maleamate amidohydrolase
MISTALQAASDRYLEESERDLLRAAGFGKRLDSGKGGTMALLVIDSTYGFCGERPEPIAEANKSHRHSCGEHAWSSLEAIQQLLATAREVGTPVVYSTMRDVSSPAWEPGLWRLKNAPNEGDPNSPEPLRNVIVDVIRPQPGELVIAKGKPSIFHGTNLLPYLISRRVDTLMICGGTTSGCVYASVVDAFSYNFRVLFVVEAVFDRVQSIHWVSLIDMDLKYGDALSLPEAIQRLRSTASAPHAVDS